MATFQATQQEYDAEYDAVSEMEEKVSGAGVIVAIKPQEWIEEKEIQKQAAREKLFLEVLQLQQAQNAADIQQLMAATPAAKPTQAAQQSTKLPQRQIKPFKGDILEWTPFWESFNAAIHSSSLLAVQKLDYLREYLKGEAYLFGESLELTDANYTIAIDELKKTYGPKDVLIDAYFNKLDTLQPVKDANHITTLKIFYLNVQSPINGLETLGVSRNTFSGLLGSRLIKLIRHKLQAKLAESSANVSTNIDGAIKFIRKQVETAERLNRLKQEKPKPPPTPPPQRQFVGTPATASQVVEGASKPTAPSFKQYFQTKTSYP
ncbi:uncharacterized protein LOC116917785 [Daphnia magna]|uniref:uncharacterized protein LOC116917785 n=1 Tax=Daphnia magna TaxID=35525 RepID=UPI001E1BDEAA|nr:uncharacterized protein LOC116917785 [Daphnia magna]